MEVGWVTHIIQTELVAGVRGMEEDAYKDDAQQLDADKEEIPHSITGEVLISPTKDRRDSDYYVNNDSLLLDGDSTSDNVSLVLPSAEKEGSDRSNVVDGYDESHHVTNSSGSSSDSNNGPAQDTEETFPPPPPSSESNFREDTGQLDDGIKDEYVDDNEIPDQGEELRRQSEQTRATYTPKEVEHLRHRIAAASYRMGKADVAGLFDRIDKDKSGQLELEELSFQLKRLMPTVSKNQITQLFRLIDKDRSNSVNKKEFVEFINQREIESPRKRIMRGTGQSLAEIEAARAASGYQQPKTMSSKSKPPRDPSQSTLMASTKSRMNDLATYLKNKEEIKDEDDPWWEKRAGKLDRMKHTFKHQYAKVESKLYQTTHSYESYKTTPKYVRKSIYKTLSPSSSGEMPTQSTGGSTGSIAEASPSSTIAGATNASRNKQISPPSVKIHHMPPGEAEMLRHKFLAASYTPQGPNIGKLFSRMDLKKTGVIDLPELIIAVRKVVPDVTDKVVIHLMEEIGTKKEGHIELNDLEEFINQRHSMQISPEHHRSGVHRTASKAASELRLQKKVNHHTFATKTIKKQPQRPEPPEPPKQPMYSIDYEAVMDHHYDVGQEYDRRQQLVETSQSSIIPNKPSQLLINAISSSIHVVESHTQPQQQHQQHQHQPQDEVDDVENTKQVIQFIQYLVDEYDHVWTLHKIHIEYFDNAFEELYHEGLNDFKDRNDVPLINKKSLAEKRQIAEDEYDRRNDLLNEALSQHELPIADALPDVDDMEENEYSSTHFILSDVSDNSNQNEVVYKYIVFPDEIVYYHSTMSADTVELDDIKNAKEEYLKKQSRVYCETSASVLAQQIHEELNDSTKSDNNIDDFYNGKGNTNHIGNDVDCEGRSFSGVRLKNSIGATSTNSNGSGSSRRTEKGGHSGPGFLRPTKNSTAGKVSK